MIKVKEIRCSIIAAKYILGKGKERLGVIIYKSNCLNKHRSQRASLAEHDYSSPQLQDKAKYQILQISRKVTEVQKDAISSGPEEIERSDQYIVAGLQEKE